MAEHRTSGRCTSRPIPTFLYGANTQNVETQTRRPVCFDEGCIVPRARARARVDANHARTSYNTRMNAIAVRGSLATWDSIDGFLRGQRKREKETRPLRRPRMITQSDVRMRRSACARALRTMCEASRDRQLRLIRAETDSGRSDGLLNALTCRQPSARDFTSSVRPPVRFYVRPFATHVDDAIELRLSRHYSYYSYVVGVNQGLVKFRYNKNICIQYIRKIMILGR